MTPLISRLPKLIVHETFEGGSSHLFGVLLLVEVGLLIIYRLSWIIAGMMNT